MREYSKQLSSFSTGGEFYDNPHYLRSEINNMFIDLPSIDLSRVILDVSAISNNYWVTFEKSKINKDLMVNKNRIITFIQDDISSMIFQVNEALDVIEYDKLDFICKVSLLHRLITYKL